jgi:hypothetical protein
LAEQASEAAAIPTQYHFLFLFLLLLLAPPLFPHKKSNHAATLNTNYAELQRLKKQQLLPENHHHHHQSNTHVSETCRREQEDQEEEGWDRVLSFRADVDLVCT